MAKSYFRQNCCHKACCPHSFLTGRSPRPTVENFSGCLRNKRSFYYNFDERNHKGKCTDRNKHTTRVYTSFFKPRSELDWTPKQGKTALASDLLRKTIITLKGFTKSSDATNDRFIMILRKENTHHKCTGENKRTTRVYASFFTSQCELH